VRNLLAVTLLAVGTPMLSMGDEVRRTQRGNNNAYCQDNETSWFDWTLVERHQDLHRFVKMLIRQRRMLGEPRVIPGLSLNEHLRRAKIEVHGVRLNRPDVSPDSHSLAITVRDPEQAEILHVMFNAYWEPLVFELPPLEPGQKWRRWIDTSGASPDDEHDWELAPSMQGTTCAVEPRSLVTLVAKSAGLANAGGSRP
jgi:glycogen operon protein